MAREKKVRPISSIESHKVYHHHIGPWVRNWTGLRSQPHAEHWNPPPAPAAARPPVFEIPLTVSLFGSTERSAEAATALVARINTIFLAAGIRFVLADLNVWDEDVDLERLPNGEWRCPFGDAVDHCVPCLHLGLVERLGDLDALTFSCGRCLMLPEHTSGSEQRAGAEGLAALMGLMLLEETAPDRLMCALGQGCRLTGPECQILRYHAARLLELPPEHARHFTLPIWAYQVCSPTAFQTSRSIADLQSLLTDVNEIWAQADLEIGLHAWCHLQETDLGLSAWESGFPWGDFALLGDHDRHALHAYFFGGPSRFGVVGQDRTLLVPDRAGTARELSRVIGHLLGLHHVPQAEQLMCVDSDGVLLTPHEIELARTAAVEIVLP